MKKDQIITKKDVISRMKQLFPNNRIDWINGILHEFGDEFGLWKYKDGYEQGKLEGAIKREKVVVPQFVADWYKEHKDDFETNLFNTIGLVIRDFEDGDLSAFEEWILDKHKAPIQTLVNMHQFGYTVEKEKRYRVKVKGVSGEARYLNHEVDGDWYINNKQETHHFKVLHTRKELEEAGFSWVFDCEGIEIEEVKE